MLTSNTSSPPLLLVMIIVVALLAITIILLKNLFQNQNALDPGIHKQLLHAYVPFFNQLNAKNQEQFLLRTQQFLAQTKIRAIKGTKIENIDLVLISASAIIPIFYFPKWNYHALSEILLFPSSLTFSHHPNSTPQKAKGLIKGNAQKHAMLLSQSALRKDFSEYSCSNTALHEFIHLIDFKDGFADGIPKKLIQKSLIKPWLYQLNTTIAEIKAQKSIIRAYAATNEVELFAVVSEHFFMRPEELQKEKPELFSLLQKIYRHE